MKVQHLSEGCFKRRWYRVFIGMVMSLWALAMLVGGCGTTGTSVNFEGDWAYVESDKKSSVYSYPDELYVIHITKHTDHTYALTYQTFEYEHRGDTFANQVAYEAGNRNMWLFGIPTSPNEAGVYAQVIPNFVFKEVKNNEKSVTATERDGKLYIDENGLAFSYDSKNDTITDGARTLHKVIDGNLEPIKEELQTAIKAYFTKTYVDTKKWEIPSFNFTDAQK